MFTLLTASFAVVIGVVALAAVLSLTSAVRRRTDALAWKCRRLEDEMKTATPMAVRHEVEELSAALAKLRAQNRREFGSLWAKVGGGRRTEYADGGIDDHLASLLALQGKTVGTPPVEEDLDLFEEE